MYITHTVIAQVTNNYTTSLLTIQATDTNATLDNGIYSCQLTLTIFGAEKFNKTSNTSTISLKGMHHSHCYMYIASWL